MPHDIAFRPEDWDRIRRDYGAWWAHELVRPLVAIHGQATDPEVAAPGYKSFTSEYGMDTPVDRIIDDVHARLANLRYYGDAFPRWWPNFGPGIMAGFLGAQVHSVPDTVWFEPREVVSAADLRLYQLEDNPWWQRILEITKAAVARWGDTVQVGHTDLGGNLDVVASMLTTERLLFDVIDQPEAIDRLVRETTAIWIDDYLALDAVIRPEGGGGCPGTNPWAPIWSEQRCYMLQCDFAYMISPEMFKRFVLPDLTACCEMLDHGFYHLDGPGEIPHLDLLLGMERLRGVQWIPGDGQPPSDKWLDLLKRIVDGGKLCQIFCSAQGALDVVRNLGGRGFLFAISDVMDEEEAYDYLALLARDCGGRA